MADLHPISRFLEGRQQTMVRLCALSVAVRMRTRRLPFLMRVDDGLYVLKDGRLCSDVARLTVNVLPDVEVVSESQPALTGDRYDVWVKGNVKVWDLTIEAAAEWLDTAIRQALSELGIDVPMVH